MAPSQVSATSQAPAAGRHTVLVVATASAGQSGAAPVQVLLADHAAALVDGRRWLHESLYWLRQEGGTDLNVTLPGPATVMTSW